VLFAGTKLQFADFYYDLVSPANRKGPAVRPPSPLGAGLETGPVIILGPPPSSPSKSEQLQAISRRRLAGSTHGFEAFLHHLLAHPVNHGGACFQSFDDPVVAPTQTNQTHKPLCPASEYNRLQNKIPRPIPYPARPASFLPESRFKPSRFPPRRSGLSKHTSLPKISFSQPWIVSLRQSLRQKQFT